MHLPSQVKHLDKYRLSDDQGCSRLVSLRERERGATRKGESAVLSGTFSIAAVTTPRHRRGETGHPTKKQPTLATDTYPRRASIVRLQSGTLPLPTYLTLPYLPSPCSVVRSHSRNLIFQATGLPWYHQLLAPPPLCHLQRRTQRRTTSELPSCEQPPLKTQSGRQQPDKRQIDLGWARHRRCPLPACSKPVVAKITRPDFPRPEQAAACRVPPGISSPALHTCVVSRPLDCRRRRRRRLLPRQGALCIDGESKPSRAHPVPGSEAAALAHAH